MSHGIYCPKWASELNYSLNPTTTEGVQLYKEVSGLRTNQAL